MAIVLYEISWSHFCEKARFCLDFKRLPYRIEAVNPFTRRQAIRAGGRGHVPVLRDGGRLVEGSNAIAAYLEEVCPEPPLLPGDASGRSEVVARCRSRGQRVSSYSVPRCMVQRLSHITRSPTRQRWV